MADNRKFVQAQRFTLAGSGCSTTATSINISSFTHIDAVGGSDIAMTDFGAVGYGTLEPGTGREELISFTGVTQNMDGTATLTGVTRNLKSYAPYDQYSATGFAHAGGASFVLSNNPGLYNSFANKENDETIAGVWTFDADNPPRLDATTAPDEDEELTNKKYVDDQNALDVHLTGDQTIAGNKTFTGDTVFNEIAAYDAHPTFVNDTDIIDKKYADDLAFAGAPDASTTVKGVVEEADAAETIAGTTTGGTGARLFVNPSALLDSAVSKTSSAGAGDSGKFIRANASGKIDPTFLTPIDTQTFTANGTWTKPTGALLVFVRVWGAGGSGGSTTNTSAAGGGGGGGAYNEGWINAALLSSSESVTVGSGGASVAGANGNPGGTSNFASRIFAYGGSGGTTGSIGGGGGGVQSAGSGRDGGAPLGGSSTVGATTFGGAYGGANASPGGAGGQSIYGGGAGGGGNNDTTGDGGAGGYSQYGGGGGGGGAGSSSGSGGVGGTSGTGGGSGGTGGSGSGGAGVAGAAPGGGGGGSNNNGASGAGARGQVIVYSFA